MNSKYNFIPWLAVAVMAVILILVRSCGPTPPPQEPTVEIVYDTLWRDTTIYVPKYVPKYVRKDSLIKVPADVDTAAILKDYYSVLVYKDTIKLDTIGFVAVEDTISQNQIISRRTWGEYKVPQVTIRETITLPPELKNKVYAGFSIQGPVMSFGPQLTLTTKQDNLYQLSAGISPAGVYVGLGMGWKIKLKR